MMRTEADGSSFPCMREQQTYYVDKTLLIKDLLDTNPEGVYLYTRPHGFGKTTNITMLDAFLNIEHVGNTWFDGLEISKHHEYNEFRNAYPVVFLRLSALSSDSFDEFMDSVRSMLAEEYKRHGFIFEPGFMTTSERNLYETMSDNTAPPSKVARGVLALSRMMERHYGKKAVILMDDYDRAVTNSSRYGRQNEIIGFIGRFMNASMKDNPYRHLAYVTGETRLTQTDIFVGPDNLWTDDVFNTRSGERFGFKESEVRDVLAHYGHPEKFDEVKTWYDGYRFGDAEVYSPSGFMTYISNGFVPGSY